MILPMMGLAFVLFLGGIVGGILLYSRKSLRHLSPFAVVPVAAGVGAVFLCSILAIVLERAFNSEVGGIGFFAGYAFGGLFGAWFGYKYAISFRTPNKDRSW
jgi:hypothetical protein